MPRRKETWSPRDVLLDQDDFEDFPDLAPLRRMPLAYDTAIDDDVPWQDPLRSAAMAGHAEGGLGTLAGRGPLTAAQRQRQMQSGSKAAARAAQRLARETAKEAVAREKAQLQKAQQVKSYLENLEWALPAEAYPGLVEPFTRYVSGCTRRTTLPRELAQQVLQAANVRDPKAYERFYLEHGRGLWLPRKATEYLDTHTRAENAAFFGVTEDELYPRQRSSPRWQPVPATGSPVAGDRPLSVHRSPQHESLRTQNVGRKSPAGRKPAQPLAESLQRYRQSKGEAPAGEASTGAANASNYVAEETAAFRQGRREFATARALAVRMRCTKVADYLVGFLDHLLSPMLHPRPDLLYSAHWQGWQHYLGSPTAVEPEETLETFLPELTPEGYVEYEFAHEYAAQTDIANEVAWRHFRARHPAVPARPEQVYANSGFTTWAKFLGKPSRARRA